MGMCSFYSNINMNNSISVIKLNTNNNINGSYRLALGYHYGNHYKLLFIIIDIACTQRIMANALKLYHPQLIKKSFISTTVIDRFNA